MITELGLKNFKSFKDIAIPFNSLTVLSGLNGSGKSSVMQAVASVKQSYDARLLVQDGLLLNGEFVNLGAGKDVLFENAEGQSITVAVTETVGRISKNYHWEFSYLEKADILSHTSVPSVDSFPQFLTNGFQFLSADRAAPAVMFPKSHSEAIRRRFLGVRGQYSVYYLAACQDENVPVGRAREPERGTQLLQQVERWLDLVSPGVGVIAREVAGADLAQLAFVYGGSAGIASSNEYRPTNVGFGLTYVLPVVVACLAARPGDLILIENPEAHLHPQGQGYMGELLARTAASGVQLIVETHSDHLINGIRRSVKNGLLEAKLTAFHFFSRESTSGTAFESPAVSPEGRFDRWPDGFFDEWDKAVLELI